MLAAALPERVLGPSFGPAMKPSSDTERSMIVGVRVRGCVKLGGPFSRGPRAVRPLCISVTVELLLGGGMVGCWSVADLGAPRELRTGSSPQCLTSSENSCATSVSTTSSRNR